MTKVSLSRDPGCQRPLQPLKTGYTLGVSNHQLNNLNHNPTVHALIFLTAYPTSVPEGLEPIPADTEKECISWTSHKLMTGPKQRQETTGTDIHSHLHDIFSETEYTDRLVTNDRKSLNPWLYIWNLVVMFCWNELGLWDDKVTPNQCKVDMSDHPMMTRSYPGVSVNLCE